MQEYQVQLTALEDYPVESGTDEAGSDQLAVHQRASFQAYAIQIEVGQVCISFEQKRGALLVARWVIQVRETVLLA